jgi:phosphoribosylformylglycinamidine cyclo-ligase
MGEREMLRTFNCGVGMICVIAPTEAEALVAHLVAQGEKAAIIGRITERGDEPVTFDGKLAL